MDEFTESAIRRALEQDEGLRRAYYHDPMKRHEVELMRQLLGSVERAMQQEGVAWERTVRVINQVVLGDPAGETYCYGEEHRKIVAVAARQGTPEQFLAILDEPGA
ncbi:hypothetical protein [Streptomyces sp. AD55]|uniref:hypothetical protein n=1 Tax=Streptomyces sp. AD55 TaxID=3242895 RepID=UPI003529BA68